MILTHTVSATLVTVKVLTRMPPFASGYIVRVGKGAFLAAAIGSQLTIIVVPFVCLAQFQKRRPTGRQIIVDVVDELALFVAAPIAITTNLMLLLLMPLGFKQLLPILRLVSVHLTLHVRNDASRTMLERAIGDEKSFL